MIMCFQVRHTNHWTTGLNVQTSSQISNGLPHEVYHTPPLQVKTLSQITQTKKPRSFAYTNFLCPNQPTGGGNGFSKLNNTRSFLHGINVVFPMSKWVSNCRPCAPNTDVLTTQLKVWITSYVDCGSPHQVYHNIMHAGWTCLLWG